MAVAPRIALRTGQRVSSKMLRTCFLASSFLPLLTAFPAPGFAQGDPLPVETNAMIAERDRLQASIARGDDGRSAEMAKLAVSDKELARGKPFSPDETKKETLLAEQDILIKARMKTDAVVGKQSGAGTGRDAFTQKDDERLAVVSMTLALGRNPTPDEQKVLKDKTLEREKLTSDLSKGKADSYVTAGRIAALDKELTQGKPLTADDTKREVLLGEQAYLQKQNPLGDQIGIFREPTKQVDRSNPVQLAVINATLAHGRDPTPEERKQIESKVAERDKLQSAMSKPTATTYETAGKLAALEKELAQGKPFTAAESKREILLGEQTYLQKQKPAPDQIGIFREPTKRVDQSNPTQLAVINTALALGRDLTPDERKQVEGKVAERDKLQASLGRSTPTTFETAGKIAALDKELAQGKPLTVAESKREVLLGEQAYLQKQKPDSPNQIGIFREPTKQPLGPSNTMQLAVVSMTLALGRDPTPDERKQLESKVAERQQLQIDVNRNGANTFVAAGKLAALDNEILKGKPFTSDESKREVLLGEQAYLSKQKPDQIGIFREPTKRSQYNPVELAAVNMTLALGRDPTPAERKQLETKISEREKLQIDIARKKPDAYVAAGKLAALDKELAQGKPFTTDESRKEVLLGEQAYLIKQKPAPDQIGIFREPTKRVDLSNPVELAVVNMALALGRDPTPAERKQIEAKVAERNKLETDVAKGGNGTRSADLRKLAALDSEIGKRETKAGGVGAVAPAANAAAVGAAGAAAAGAAKIAIPFIGKRLVTEPRASASRSEAAKAASIGATRATISSKPLRAVDSVKALMRRSTSLDAKPKVSAQAGKPMVLARPVVSSTPFKPAKIELPKAGAAILRH